MIATREKRAPTSNGARRDPAMEMLLLNSVGVLRAFMECSDEMQHGVLEMAKIIADPVVDDDEKEAAEETLIEALYPKYFGQELGIDSAKYEETERRIEPRLEKELDTQEEVFASVLQKLMNERKITQKDLAEKIGVSQPAIANMLARCCRPQRRTIEKIANAFGVDSKIIWPFTD